jgi:hypothetical protein
MDNEIRVEATTYTICGLPEDDPDSLIWSIEVQHRGRDQWAVIHLGECWNFRTKHWDWEPSPSNRDDKFIKNHRRDKATALRVATEVYPTLVVNSFCVRDGKLVRAS